MDVAFWRRWHRWIGFPAFLFLAWAAGTGMIVAAREFFGEEEALREATRDLVSPMKADASLEVWQPAIGRALLAVAKQAGSVPIDKIEYQFKGKQPTVTVFTGKPTGGEDRKFVVDAGTGQVIKTEAYADKPFLTRLHSGEAFGDGGLVVAMFWGLSLAIMGVTGLLIYWSMRGKRELTGIKRIFW